MSETPEVFDDSESPIPLKGRADVRRALAKVIRQIHRGTMAHNVGQVLIIGLGTLAKIMHEDDESDLIRRIEAIEHAKAQESAVQ